jgi:hypothetical protein
MIKKKKFKDKLLFLTGVDNAEGDKMVKIGIKRMINNLNLVWASSLAD